MLDREFGGDGGGRVGIVHDPGLLVGFKMNRLDPVGRHLFKKPAGCLDGGVAILTTGKQFMIAVGNRPCGTKFLGQLRGVGLRTECIDIDIMKGGWQAADPHF